MATSELPEYAERVLSVVERIPPGRVMTYGDLAEWVRDEMDEAEEAWESGPDDPAAPVDLAEESFTAADGGWSGGSSRPGPRQVGRVLALYGGAVPWWRVVRADGVLLPNHERRALEHYRAEGTPLRAVVSGGAARTWRIDLRQARWAGVALAGAERQSGLVEGEV